jgi:hypothetical protein|eukprot:COSAG01_NODE_132_length_24759_cov_13.862298_6_plen_93_part_00
MLLVLMLPTLLGVVGVALAAAHTPPAPPPCTHDNKQIALYLDYQYRPGEDLVSSPVSVASHSQAAAPAGWLPARSPPSHTRQNAARLLQSAA